MPLLFVPKPNNTTRFCVDYGPPNTMTVLDSYLIPRLNVFIETIGWAMMFSTLDAHFGY